MNWNDDRAREILTGLAGDSADTLTNPSDDVIQQLLSQMEQEGYSIDDGPATGIAAMGVQEPTEESDLTGDGTPDILPGSDLEQLIEQISALPVEDQQQLVSHFANTADDVSSEHKTTSGNSLAKLIGSLKI